MEVILMDGCTLKSDNLQYVLIVGTTTYYYRSLTDALSRAIELVRKDKTSAFTGDLERYTDLIIKSNAEILETILKNINESEVGNGKRS